MKNARICIIATIITVLIIVSCAYAMPVKAESRPEFYNKIVVVFDTEKVGNEWIIFCYDESRNFWSFYDTQDVWEQGDIAEVLMHNWDGIEEDDQMISIVWSGTVDSLSGFFK